MQWYLIVEWNISLPLYWIGLWQAVSRKMTSFMPSSTLVSFATQVSPRTNSYKVMSVHCCIAKCYKVVKGIVVSSDLYVHRMPWPKEDGRSRTGFDVMPYTFSQLCLQEKREITAQRMLKIKWKTCWKDREVFFNLCDVNLIDLRKYWYTPTWDAVLCWRMYWRLWSCHLGKYTS